jgi:WD40 repeat protein
VAPLLTHDGSRVITTTAEGTEIRDAVTLRVRRRWPVGADVAALSPDDRTLLLGGTDGSLRFLDLRNGRVRSASGRHAGPVVRATFGPDGRTAVTAGEDNRVLVWDIGRRAISETLDGHAGQTTSLAISRDGGTLYTGALDGKVLIWDLSGRHRLDRPFRVDSAAPLSSGDFPFISTALSHDGRVLAAGHADGSVSLIDVRTLRVSSTFRAVPRGPVRALGYIPHTGLLVVGGDDGYLGIYDPDTGRRVQRLNGDRLSSEVAVAQVPPSFSADGRLMATAALGGDVLLSRLRGGRAVGAPRRYGPSLGTIDASLSPDGRTLVVAMSAGVEVVDVATLRLRAYLPGATSIAIAQFTPDGRWVIGGSFNGWVRLWSAKTWQPAGRALAGHTGEALSASVSPDGRTVATGSDDGTIRLYDVATHEAVGAPLPAVPNRTVAPLFTPDGDYLLAVTSTGQAYRWDVRPSAWAQRACAIAGRTLTRAEWNDALPGRAYAPACTS